MPDHLQDILDRRKVPRKSNPIRFALTPVHMNMAYHGFGRVRPKFTSSEYREVINPVPDEQPQRVIDLSE